VNGDRQLATGRQLWALNAAGLLRAALDRADGDTIDKRTAHTMIADLYRPSLYARRVTRVTRVKGL
jgi:hypothetical protein